MIGSKYADNRRRINVGIGSNHIISGPISIPRWGILKRIIASLISIARCSIFKRPMPATLLKP